MMALMKGQWVQFITVNHMQAMIVYTKIARYFSLDQSG